MQRLFSILLVAFLCSTISATVKPRYRAKGFQTAWETTVFDATASSANGRRLVGSQATAPLTSMGSPKVPVVLVQFPDLQFTSGLSDGTASATEEDIAAVNAFFTKYCNGDGVNSYFTGAGSGGAIAEYFRDQSNGMFIPDFTVLGPVTLERSYRYYGENGSRKGSDIHISEFYSEAIQKAQEQNSDWSMFDNDENGTVDMVFFIYAGEGENTSKDPDEIWPKEMASGGVINGVRYGAYACCNELFIGQTDGIGVFIHELSHALGMPDLYDYNLVQFGMDYWDIMDSGCYCRNGYVPCGYSAYEKDFMGWQPLITLSTDEPQHLKLTPVSKGGSGYKIVNPENPNEYYVIENRQNHLWDSYIARSTASYRIHGLLVTHVDYNWNSWWYNSVNTVDNAADQRFTLIPADGTLDSYMNVNDINDYNTYMLSIAGDPFPGLADVHSLEGDRAIVNTRTGETPGLMNQALINIVENEDGTIELDYCPFGKKPLTIMADNLTMEYGDEVPPLSYTIEGGEPEGTPLLSCEATSTSPVGTYPIIVSQGSVTDNKASFINGTLTITKAPLTIKAGEYTKEQGEENPEFTLTYEGFKNNETSVVLITQPKVTTTAVKESPVGEYDVVVSGAEAQNYEISYVNGKLTIVVPVGINEVECDQSTTIYNLAGQRLSKPQRGVNIINGKKVIVR